MSDDFSTQTALDALGALCPFTATDIDDLLAPYDARCNPIGRPVFPAARAAALPPPPLVAQDIIAIGARLARMPAQPSETARRLAAFGLERKVNMVVLCDDDYAGLESFGFRCERVAGANEAERAACMAELRDFWRLDLVI